MERLKFLATLPKGEDSRELYKKIKEDEKNFKYGLGFIDLYSDEIRGSNPLRTGQINRILKNSNRRIAVPSDNYMGKIHRLIKNRYSTDFNSLIIHENPPSYKGNLNLWTKLIELSEEKNGRIDFPFMIQGFYTVPDLSEIEYRIKIVPGPSFEIVEDKRLSEKYNGRKFNTFDEMGLPSFEELKKNDENLTFRTRNDGIARMELGYDFNCNFSNLSDFVCEDPNTSSRMIFVED